MICERPKAQTTAFHSLEEVSHFLQTAQIYNKSSDLQGKLVYDANLVFSHFWIFYNNSPFCLLVCSELNLEFVGSPGIGVCGVGTHARSDAGMHESAVLFINILADISALLRTGLCGRWIYYEQLGRLPL